MSAIDRVMKRLDTRLRSVDGRIRDIVSGRSEPDIDRAIMGLRSNFSCRGTGSRVGLCVGLPFVDKAAYDGCDQPCPGCDVDAIDFAKVLDAAGFSTTLLLSEQATKSNVLSAMTATAAQLENGGLFVMSIAGHGARRAVPEDGNRMHEYWCLWDGMAIDTDIVSVVKTFRPGVRIVMINDQCHCGGIFTSERGELPMLIQFAACRAEQSSIGTHIGGTWTTALMKVLAVDREISWRQWFDKAVVHPSLTKNQSPQWVEVGPVTNEFRNGRIFDSQITNTTEVKTMEENMERSFLSGLFGRRKRKLFCKRCGSYYWADDGDTGENGCPHCKNPPIADGMADGEPRSVKKFCNKCGTTTYFSDSDWVYNCRKCGARLY